MAKQKDWEEKYLEWIGSMGHLPKLKNGCRYIVKSDGEISIRSVKISLDNITLFYNLKYALKGMYRHNLKDYEGYFSKPVIETKVVEKIVGYE